MSGYSAQCQVCGHIWTAREPDDPHQPASLLKDVICPDCGAKSPMLVHWWIGPRQHGNAKS